ncbi:unnamed protein product [Miscanthus lutarioriparius]|uniref:Uncharacterized protein n=1 Tax=Miscanthus lutarioriparius TaxID=422564 RepID=A0A811S551_9POAL|nr:unnamed protein product [Miscanthus lutarioriparius]
MESADALNSEGTDSVVAMESVDALDFVDVVPDSVEEVLDSDVVLPDSIEVLPDSDQLDEVVHYPRCGTFHAGGVFGEACYEARLEARRCARCGLLHEDYNLIARVCDKMEKFDCEVYIPDVHELQMRGDTILLPEHVMKKLDEQYNMKKLEEQKLKQLESQANDECIHDQ